MSIEKIKSVKTQMKRHESAFKKVSDGNLEIHVLLCEDLQHCAEHGDTSLLKHLYETCGGNGASPVRTQTLMEWVRLMSGNKITAEKGEWKLKKGWKSTDFLLEEAEAKPFWTLRPEPEMKSLSWDAIIGMMKNYLKKIDREAERDNFNGDPEAIKGIMGETINFAEARAKRLSAIQLGTLESQADAILTGNKAHIEGEITVNETLKDRVA